MVESYSSGSSRERNVYKHSTAIQIMDYKISAIDVHGRIFFQTHIYS